MKVSEAILGRKVTLTGTIVGTGKLDSIDDGSEHYVAKIAVDNSVCTFSDSCYVTIQLEEDAR